MDCFASLAMTMKRLFENLNRKGPQTHWSCAGLTRASIKRRRFSQRVMDCRVKPGNDDPADKSSWLLEN
jgi:hypothetical protein